MSKSTMAELVASKMKKPRDIIPSGFLTLEEWAMKLNISDKNRLGKALKKLVAEGKVHAKKFFGEKDFRPVTRFKEV